MLEWNRMTIEAQEIVGRMCYEEMARAHAEWLRENLALEDVDDARQE